jgi:hypothetical protein
VEEGRCAQYTIRGQTADSSMNIFYPITEIVKMQDFALIVEKAGY